MSDSERPPLDRRVLEQIELALDATDREHWKIISSFQVSPDVITKRPLPPPKTPEILLDSVRTYASVLFKREADQYGQFGKNSNYAPWLMKLEERVIARAFRTIKAMEQANHPATLAYHGLTDAEISHGLGFMLWDIRSGYIQRGTNPQIQISALNVQVKSEPPSKAQDYPKRIPRMPSTIHSPNAARKMEEFIIKSNLNQTEFASRAGTTDRTLRSFRNTGRIRRSLLGGIAKTMGITEEELLRD